MDKRTVDILTEWGFEDCIEAFKSEYLFKFFFVFYINIKKHFNLNIGSVQM
jgi:hypothetical protein